MAVAFPLTGMPSYYTRISWGNRNGIFYVGDTIAFTLDKATASTYTIRDYYGNTISTGSVTGVNLSPAVPNGGWKKGWYRLYLTGATNDATFGFAYGVTNFVILNSDSRFISATAPAGSYFNKGANFADLAGAAMFQYGPARLTISNTNSPATGAILLTDATAAATTAMSWYANPAYQDSVRPHDYFTQFPNGTVDTLALQDSGGATGILVYPLNGTLNPGQIFLTVTAGSSSGVKIQVSYPNNATVVETYDNLANNGTAATAINASSTKIMFCALTGSTVAIAAVTAIGNSYQTGLRSCVSSIYAAGCAYFEGPFNEPQGTGTTNAVEVAHQMRLFYDNVKAANPAAQVLGPGPVSINASVLPWVDAFLAAGGGSYVDALSFHAYNNIITDLSLGRLVLDRLAATLAKYSFTKPLWQTEEGTVWTANLGVYHPRRAKQYLLHTLLQEQYGILKEHNGPFNDASNGFWSIPAWFVNSGGSVNPQAPMMRILAEELYGKTFTSRYNFGEPGDRIYLGSLYTDGVTNNKVAVFMASSTQLVGQVVLQVGGAVALTVLDCFGNTSTVSVVNGRATIPVQETPVYVRLPVGTTATLYSYGDRPPIAGITGNAASNLSLRAVPVGTTDQGPQAGVQYLADGQWQNYYNLSGVAPFTHVNSTGWASVYFSGLPITLDRVTIWSGEAYQADGALLDFDIDTSNDGSTWTTQATVTRPTPSSFLHGAAASSASTGDTGTQRETYWDEMWIFDVKLTAPVTAKYVRVNVRSASYGGEPDSAAATANTSTGAGSPTTPKITIQQIGIYSDDITRQRFVLS